MSGRLNGSSVHLHPRAFTPDRLQFDREGHARLRRAQLRKERRRKALVVLGLTVLCLVCGAAGGAAWGWFLDVVR